MSKRPELVIGFVAPIGVSITFLCSETTQVLREFNYAVEEIHLSALLERAANWKPLADKSEDKRVKYLQEVAFEFRTKTETPRALALAALVAIRERRAIRSRSPDAPADGVVYLLNQLKHPDEVKLLRDVYGSSFVLIAAHATRESREGRLKRKIADSESRGIQNGDKVRSEVLMETDEEEIGPSGANRFGQNTRNTYPLADIFVNLEQEAKASLEIKRFLYLLFGHPFHTPRPDEVAMYHASAASLRSSDESRQVGAVIVNVKQDSEQRTSDLEIISSGMNEVPRRGGGFYWDDSGHSPDARDQWLKKWWNEDRAMGIKKGVLTELLEVLRSQDWFVENIKSEQTADLVDKLISRSLVGTQFMNIGEFQRQVHAEMAAIIDSARRGIPVDGQSMFVTTFPCHNCAKHIIAAGIRRVVYLEPYPKSRADDLHKEEIQLDPHPGAESLDRVIFSPYAGVAPRQYQRLFSMAGRGKKSYRSWGEWEDNKLSLSPQYLQNNAAASHVQNEREELASLSTNLFEWDPALVCP